MWIIHSVATRSRGSPHQPQLDGGGVVGNLRAGTDSDSHAMVPNTKRLICLI
jgi:hypothetical protein